MGTDMKSAKSIFAPAVFLAATLLTPYTSNASELVLPPALKEKGNIIVAIESTYPPMAYRNPKTNERLGFNVDLVTAMAQKMGIEVKWEELSFEQLATALEVGRVDLVGTAISDLPSRREKMTFVDYLRTGAQPFTTVANAQKLKTSADLCGLTVGAPSSTNYFPATKAWNEKNCVGAGKAAMTVNGTQGATAARLDLKQGRLDAAVLGPEYVSHLMRDEPDTYVLVGDPLIETLFGLAVSKKDPAMRDAVAGAITSLIKDGTYMSLLKKYGLERQAMAEVKIDAGQ
ncbi:transporter substrate-binding domain-containing protein [Rhizobium wenxiniae]|uniref:transporter substrate-binding domain-containing protein n=1 Tax=Rhizobium wenxiniae TaxID=1737357 RepID=UPI003C170027